MFIRSNHGFYAQMVSIFPIHHTPLLFTSVLSKLWATKAAQVPGTVWLHCPLETTHLMLVTSDPNHVARPSIAASITGHFGPDAPEGFDGVDHEDSDHDGDDEG